MMQEQYRQPRIPRHPAVLWSRIKYRWPFLVWLAAVAMALFLYSHTGRFGVLSGVVDVTRIDVAPVEAGRIETVHVVSGQAVAQGDLLVTMDTALLDAELEVDRLRLERQFEREIQQMEESLRDLRIRQASDAAELEVLDSEIDRLEQLLAQRLVDAQTVARIRAQQAGLTRAVELYPSTIDALVDSLAEAEAHKLALSQWLEGQPPPSAPGATAAQPDGAEPLPVGLHHLRRMSYELRAVTDGYVSRVLHNPGDVVGAGEPILTVVAEGSKLVIGFLPETNARDIPVGAKAFLSKPQSAGPYMPATVIALGPEILGLPGRISPMPGQTVRGRSVVFAPDAPNNLLPGESVSIRVVRPWREFLLGPPKQRKNPALMEP